MDVILIETSKELFKPIIQYKNQSVYFFRFDCIETEVNTIRCNETTIMLKNATYDKMVSACIEIKYSIDAQLALLYNYQLNQSEYQEQMNEYQAWRTYCKESCRNFFNIA